ncbi:MAG: thiamine pyrophosphate-binding protein [Armatimonadetes bacterium]|nr:thiamine pyrophosphate-binding protein [Armatimonadota bacterium]
MLTKHQFLEPLSRLRTNEVVVTSMGMVRPWAKHSSSDLDFASADSAMGHTADFALGIALARPDRKVICLNGDGSMLMTLGTLVSIVASGAYNLILFVIENHTYEITGNQPVPGGGQVDFAAMAKAAGFERVHHFDDVTEYESCLPVILSAEGPVFVSVETEAGSEGPLSRGNPDEVAYLRPSLAESARALREALQETAPGIDTP